MLRISHHTAVAALTESDYPFIFTGEASSLDMVPGEWPESFELVDFPIGNDKPFFRFKDIVEADELVAVEYRQQDGTITIRVYND
jgi:hypothetical protein